MYLNQKPKKLETLVPMSDVLKQIVSSKVLNIDINQSTLTSINSMATHNLQIIRHIMKVTQISHVNGFPHGGVHRNAPPRSAHILSARDDLYSAQFEKNGSGDVTRKVKPVPLFTFGFGVLGLVGGGR